ncbi:MAG: hypothetical protein NTW68_01870 [candidate division NC10 bacterium]|nr:hypothetical protein [candidate division NC10 bacterium]
MESADMPSVSKIGTYDDEQEESNETQQLGDAVKSVPKRCALLLADTLAFVIPHWIYE